MHKICERVFFFGGLVRTVSIDGPCPDGRAFEFACDCIEALHGGKVGVDVAVSHCGKVLVVQMPSSGFRVVEGELGSGR